MNKTEVQLLQTSSNYKKLYVMNEKIEKYQSEGYSHEEICKLIDEYFEYGVISNTVVKLDHPAEIAVREGFRYSENHPNQLHNELIRLEDYDFNDEMEIENNNNTNNNEIQSNHLIFDNTLKETRFQNQKSKRNSKENDEVIIIDENETKTKDYNENESYLSSFSSNPHVLNVCKTFRCKIYSDNDLADAVLDCLDY